MKTIKAVTNLNTKSGRIFYSNMISKAAPGVIGKSIYLYQHSTSYFLVANAEENERGRIVMFDSHGELLHSQLITVYKGKNTIEVSASRKSNAQPHIIAVYLEKQLAFMQKLI